MRHEVISVFGQSVSRSDTEKDRERANISVISKICSNLMECFLGCFSTKHGLSYIKQNLRVLALMCKKDLMISQHMSELEARHINIY